MPDDLRDDPLLAGVPEVDGYKVLDPAVLYARIGAGGMGSVYRGRHVNLEIDVAVKVLDPDLARKDKEFVARFRREANLAAKINHPNLVRVFDVKEGAGLHYLVMEYVEGETALERVARKGPLGAVEAIDIVVEAARGLGAAHAQGVVHRDVKPENLLIDRAGNVKVADLGLAHVTESGGGLTHTKVQMGTPRYMAPEQWEDARSVGPPGDVWALGATMYFLLAGDHAIREGSMPEIFRRVCVEPFPDIRKRRPEMPDDLAEMLERCTAKLPADRFADATELAAALSVFRMRVKTRRLLVDDDAGSGTARTSAVTPPPSKTIAKVATAVREAALHASRSPPPPLVGVPGASRKRPWVLIAGAVVILAAGVYGYVRWRTEEPARPRPADHAQVFHLKAKVHALRERLAELSQEVQERIERSEDETERAILKRLETAIWDVLSGEPLSLADGSILSGDAKLAAREYGKAQAEFETAQRGLEEILRGLRTGEDRFRAEAAVDAADALRAEVAEWYATNGLLEPAPLRRGTEALESAREEFRAGRFGRAAIAAREASGHLRAAREAGAPLVAQRAEALKAKEAAERALAELEALGNASSARETLEAAARAMETQQFRDAKTAYDTARAAFEAALVAGRAHAAAAAGRERALAAQARWKDLEAALGGSAEAAAATSALERGERALSLGDHGTALREFEDAKTHFDAAVAEGSAILDRARAGPGPGAEVGDVVRWLRGTKLGYTETGRLLGWLQTRKDRIGEATEAIRMAIAADPASPDLHVALATAYVAAIEIDSSQQRALWPKAEAAYDAALKLEPDHWAARFGKASGTSRIPDRRADAIRQFEELIEIQKRRPRERHFAGAYMQLGRLYMDAGRVEEARKRWAAGLELFPDDEELKSAVEECGAVLARDAARKAKAVWEEAWKTRRLKPPAEARTADAVMARAEEQFAKLSFAAAAETFAAAEQGYRLAVQRYPARLPAEWKVLDKRTGFGGWARKAEDPRTGIAFLLVEPGAFQMGSPEGEGLAEERPRHEVRITKPFYLAETETTVGQWRKFAEAKGYRTSGGGGTVNASGGWEQRDAAWSDPLPLHSFALDERHPVTQLNWGDAKAFCDQFGYRLPTEAEWEYACRAGTRGRYWWGERDADGKGRGNFADQATKAKFPGWKAFPFDDGHVFLAPVGTFEPNAWGLRDMLGNAWEWCADGYEDGFYRGKARDDPVRAAGPTRVLRGGSWASDPGDCRAARRGRNIASHRYADYGFRAARSCD